MPHARHVLPILLAIPLLCAVAAEKEPKPSAAKFSPKLPEGYELVTAFIAEECPPTDAFDKLVAFAQRIEKEKAAKWGLQIGEQPVFGDFSWKPALPANVSRVRLFVPRFKAGRLVVLVDDKEVWSLDKDGADVLSPEISVAPGGAQPTGVMVRVSKVDPVIVRGAANVFVVVPKRAPSK